MRLIELHQLKLPRLLRKPNYKEKKLIESVKKHKLLRNVNCSKPKKLNFGNRKLWNRLKD